MNRNKCPNPSNSLLAEYVLVNFFLTRLIKWKLQDGLDWITIYYMLSSARAYGSLPLTIKPVKLRIVKFCFNYLSQPFQADFTWLFTGLAVAQPSFKMGLVFPSGTNRTLGCSARASDIRVCLE